MKRQRLNSQDECIDDSSIRGALDYITEGILILAPEEGRWRVTYCNTVAQQYLAITNENIADMTCDRMEFINKYVFIFDSFSEDSRDKCEEVGELLNGKDFSLSFSFAVHNCHTTKSQAKRLFTAVIKMTKYLIETTFNHTPDGLIIVSMRGHSHVYPLHAKKFCDVDEQQALLLMSSKVKSPCNTFALDLDERDMLLIYYNKIFVDTFFPGEYGFIYTRSRVNTSVHRLSQSVHIRSNIYIELL